MTTGKIYTILFITGFLLIGFSVNAQQKDPAAMKILENFQKKIQSFPAIKSEYQFTIIDLKENSESTYKGEFSMKDEKYVMKMGNMEIYYDGTTLWNFLPEEGEVNISAPELSDEQDFLENPALFFKLYKKDLYNKLVEEKNVDGVIYNIIDLYPKDLNKGFSRIRLFIEKDELELYSIRYFGKDGIHYLLLLTDYETNKLPDSWFQFDVSKHPNVEVIDLR